MSRHRRVYTVARCKRVLTCHKIVVLKVWLHETSQSKCNTVSKVKVPLMSRMGQVSILIAYSHCTRMQPGEVQGTGPAQWETMDPGSVPYLRPVQTFLCNILGPITPGPLPCTVPVPCSVKKPRSLSTMLNLHGTDVTCEQTLTVCSRKKVSTKSIHFVVSYRKKWIILRAIEWGCTGGGAWDVTIWEVPLDCCCMRGWASPIGNSFPSYVKQESSAYHPRCILSVACPVWGYPCPGSAWGKEVGVTLSWSCLLGEGEEVGWFPCPVTWPGYTPCPSPTQTWPGLRLWTDQWQD